MNKPMYCPMSFMPISVFRYINTGETVKREYEPMECTPDCAWAAKDDEDYWCGMISTTSCNINTRPLDDAVLQTTPNYSKEDDAE